MENNYYKSTLAHFGTNGMKWGVRRFQNEDGTLTEAGKRRYYKSNGSLTRAGKKRLAGMTDEQIHREMSRNMLERQYEKSVRDGRISKETKKKTLDDDLKNLSNDEMQSLIDRHKLETAYKQEFYVKSGKEQFSSIIKKKTMEGVGTLASYAVTKTGEALVDKLISQYISSSSSKRKPSGSGGSGSSTP